MCRRSTLNVCLLAALVVCAGCARSGKKEPQEKRHGTSPTDVSPVVRNDNHRFQVIHPDSSLLKEIHEDDPANELLTSFVDRVTKQHAPKGLDCKELICPAAKQLFPNHRFFICQWHDNGAICIDALALGRDPTLISIGRGHRYDMDFGEFLAMHKVRIADPGAAHLVWDAFRAIRCRFSESNTVEKVSDRLWRLGIQDDRDKGLGKAYYEVHLNKDLTVESAKWIIEDKIERRK